MTAIGCPRAWNETLKALRFRWTPAEGVWTFPAGINALEEDLQALAAKLGCRREMSDTRRVPPLPLKDSSPKVVEPDSEQVPIPKWAVICCPAPGKRMTLRESMRKEVTLIASLDWPLRVQDIPEVTDAGLPPEVPRVVVLPGMEELASLGLTQPDVWKLLSDLAAIEVALTTVDDLIDLTDASQAIRRLPHGPGALAYSRGTRSKSKGGRPATAQVKSPEVLNLAKEGMSAGAIAKALGISSRSVRRILASCSTETSSGGSKP